MHQIVRIVYKGLRPNYRHRREFRISGGINKRGIRSFTLSGGSRMKKRNDKLTSGEMTRRQFMDKAIRMGIAAVATSSFAETCEISARASSVSEFVHIQGEGFTLNGNPFRNIGANIPDLFVRFLHDDDKAVSQVVENAASVGVRVVRCFGSTWGWDDFQIFDNDRKRWIAAYDRMIRVVRDAGIRLVPSLLFNLEMIPRYLQKYKNMPDEQVVNLLTPGSPSNRLASEYVATIVERYADNPGVFMWEIGNEYNLSADLSAQWKERPANQIPTSDNIRAFLQQIAELIRKNDSRHPITSGNGNMRTYAWHIRQGMLAHQKDANPFDYPMDWSKDTLTEYYEMIKWFDPSPLDVVCVHDYPPGKDVYAWLNVDDTHDLILPYARKAADRLRQPLFVGEFGGVIYQNGAEVTSPFIQDILKQIREGVVPIALIWAWEFANGDPNQNTFSLSLDRTPRLCAQIKETNKALES